MPRPGRAPPPPDASARMHTVFWTMATITSWTTKASERSRVRPAVSSVLRQSSVGVRSPRARLRCSGSMKVRRFSTPAFAGAEVAGHAHGPGPVEVGRARGGREALPRHDLATEGTSALLGLCAAASPRPSSSEANRVTRPTSWAVCAVPRRGLATPTIRGDGRRLPRADARGGATGGAPALAAPSGARPLRMHACRWTGRSPSSTTPAGGWPTATSSRMPSSGG